MRIEQEINDDEVRFTVTGSLSGTEHSTIQVFETVSIALDKKPEKIVLDLAGATFIDSMSIGLLVGILLKCKERGTSFRLENLRDHIIEILDSVKLKKVFPELY